MAHFRWPFDERASFAGELARSFFQDPFFQDGLGTPRGSGVFPPVNVFENGEAYRIRAEIPGVDKETLDVSVKGDELTLRGERRIEAAEAAASYHRRERSGGQFRRTVTLPRPVDSENIRASYRNGVLEVELPFVPESKPRKIAIH